MTNSFLNLSQQKQRGAATLITSIVLMVGATLIVLFMGNYARMQSKTTANQARSTQAFEAAEAGLEFGIQYLKQNSTTILASPVGGYIPAYTSSSTTNVTLANNSSFSITYTNPVANNYKLILVTSAGTSDDSTATRTVSQLVQFGSVLVSPPSYPLVTKGTVSLSGNSTITNTQSNQTVQSSSTVSMSGNSRTVTSSGTSSIPGHIQSDVQQNNSTISGMSSSDFFASYFGASAATIKTQASYYYTNSSSTNYNSQLAGKTGTFVWIDQTGGSAGVNGNTTIGTAANPVLLVVNGDFDVSGNVTIYGMVVVLGHTSTETDITGNVTITGGLISGDNLGMSGNTNITFSQTVIDNLQKQSSMMYYAKVAGSWKDF